MIKLFGFYFLVIFPFLAIIGGYSTVNLIRSFKLKKKYIPGIGQYDPELDICWFIPRSIEIKKTKNNKNYMVIDVVDDTSKTIKIKCWNMIDKNSVQLNHVYIGKLIYEEQYGFSCKNVKLNFKLIE